MAIFQRLPLHDLAVQSGAALNDQSGWLMPESYPGETFNPHAAIGLFDQSNCGKLFIQGHSGGKILTAISIESPDVIGNGVTSGVVSVYRLRADQLFISTPPGHESGILLALETAGSDVGFTTVTDITHGHSQIRLVGRPVTDLLRRVCSLDFNSSSFPNRCVKQASVAKTKQLIIKDDLFEEVVPSYVMIGARSLGVYLWNTLMNVGRDFGIQPIGIAQLEQDDIQSVVDAG